ncbi:hypothetical protein B0H14DRAFT_3693499 [Mycena olivaceomarginata]|nr:hypothetical protein B0H14DRAFT_3693499 [Mycena olivaceomarginata]
MNTNALPPQPPGPAASANTVSTPNTTGTAIPTAIKRKIDEITATFPATDARKKKRPKRSPNAAKTTAERLDGVARYFAGGVHPYMDIGSALDYGSQHHWGPPVEIVPSNTIQMPESERIRQDACVAAFNKMFSIAPDLLELIKYIFLQAEEDSDHWNKLVASMRASASSGRVADTGGLKHCVEYILPNPSLHALLPAIPKHDSKSIRGLAHPILRYFLLPWSLRLKLPPLQLPTVTQLVPNVAVPAAPNEFLDRIVAGNFKFEIDSNELPSFLWAHDSYNSADFDHGLLRGEFLLRVFRHIWTAPASAYNGLDTGIPAVCHARLHDKLTVSPEMLGCAVVQARTMISSKDWGRRDGAFDNEALFDAVVNLFSGLPEDPWAIETLAWMVFGDSAPASAVSDASPAPSAAEAILAQRAARRAAAQAPLCLCLRFLCFINDVSQPRPFCLFCIKLYLSLRITQYFCFCIMCALLISIFLVPDPLATQGASLQFDHDLSWTPPKLPAALCITQA